MNPLVMKLALPLGFVLAGGIYYFVFVERSQPQPQPLPEMNQRQVETVRSPPNGYPVRWLEAAKVTT